MSLSHSLKEVFRVDFDIDETNRLLNQIIKEIKNNEIKSFTGSIFTNSNLSK